jgi:guanylate kinase
MKQQNFVLIISSPSGAGKTSIVKELNLKDKNFINSVSVTTRPKRVGEIHGKDYFFVNQEEFDLLKQEDKLLESAHVFGNNYGSPKQFVLDNLNNGFDVLFDIDWQGAQTVKAKLKNLAVSIYILPPSLEELARRLKNRGQDSDDIIQLRMQQSTQEISHYNEYDYVLVNDNLDQTITQILTIISAERLKRQNFQAFIKDNFYQSNK